MSLAIIAANTQFCSLFFKLAYFWASIKVVPASFFLWDIFSVIQTEQE